MPGYIGFTPQFNPISLQDYLTVPMMVLNEYNKAEEQYNETANKAEALKALLANVVSFAKCIGVVIAPANSAPP